MVAHNKGKWVINFWRETSSMTAWVKWATHLLTTPIIWRAKANINRLTQKMKAEDHIRILRSCAQLNFTKTRQAAGFANKSLMVSFRTKLIVNFAAVLYAKNAAKERDPTQLIRMNSRLYVTDAMYSTCIKLYSMNTSAERKREKTSTKIRFKLISSWNSRYKPTSNRRNRSFQTCANSSWNLNKIKANSRKNWPRKNCRFKKLKIKIRN